MPAKYLEKLRWQYLVFILLTSVAFLLFLILFIVFAVINVTRFEVDVARVAIVAEEGQYSKCSGIGILDVETMLCVPYDESFPVDNDNVAKNHGQLSDVIVATAATLFSFLLLSESAGGEKVGVLLGDFNFYGDAKASKILALDSSTMQFSEITRETIISTSSAPEHADLDGEFLCLCGARVAPGAAEVLTTSTTLLCMNVSNYPNAEVSTFKEDELCGCERVVVANGGALLFLVTTLRSSVLNDTICDAQSELNLIQLSRSNEPFVAGNVSNGAWSMTVLLTGTFALIDIDFFNGVLYVAVQFHDASAVPSLNLCNPSELRSLNGNVDLFAYDPVHACWFDASLPNVPVGGVLLNRYAVQRAGSLGIWFYGYTFDSGNGGSGISEPYRLTYRVDLSTNSTTLAFVNASLSGFRPVRVSSTAEMPLAIGFGSLSAGGSNHSSLICRLHHSLAFWDCPSTCESGSLVCEQDVPSSLVMVNVDSVGDLWRFAYYATTDPADPSILKVAVGSDMNRNEVSLYRRAPPTNILTFRHALVVPAVSISSLFEWFDGYEWRAHGVGRCQMVTRQSYWSAHVWRFGMIAVEGGPLALNPKNAFLLVRCGITSTTTDYSIYEAYIYHFKLEKDTRAVAVDEEPLLEITYNVPNKLFNEHDPGYLVALGGRAGGVEPTLIVGGSPFVTYTVCTSGKVNCIEVSSGLFMYDWRVDHLRASVLSMHLVVSSLYVLPNDDLLVGFYAVNSDFYQSSSSSNKDTLVRIIENGRDPKNYNSAEAQIYVPYMNTFEQQSMVLGFSPFLADGNYQRYVLVYGDFALNRTDYDLLLIDTELWQFNTVYLSRCFNSTGVTKLIEQIVPLNYVTDIDAVKSSAAEDDDDDKELRKQVVKTSQGAKGGLLLQYASERDRSSNIAFLPRDCALSSDAPWELGNGFTAITKYQQPSKRQTHVPHWITFLVLMIICFICASVASGIYWFRLH